jgi:hypothetical protein
MRYLEGLRIIRFMISIPEIQIPEIPKRKYAQCQTVCLPGILGNSDLIKYQHLDHVNLLLTIELRSKGTILR